MKPNSIYDKDKLAKIYKGGNSALVSKTFHVDPRKACRALRNNGLLNSPEPEDSIKMRIKDTELGRELAKRLGLKVGVIYPDEYYRSDTEPTEER